MAKEQKAQTRPSRKDLEAMSKGELIDIIEALYDRIEALEQKLGINSHNSSKPPSSDGPEVEKPAKKSRKKKRKQGAQPGHEPHLRVPFAEEDVTESYDLTPKECAHCGSNNVHESGEDPRLHQTCEIPPIKPIVIQYIMHTVDCADCGNQTVAGLPKNVSPSPFTSSVVSCVAILTGVLHLSKRKALVALEDLFNSPISLGGVSACEARVSEALEAPVEEGHEYAQDQASANADETSWRRGNKIKGWLWVIVANAVAIFKVQATRSKESARNILGRFKGILSVDRYCAYRVHNGLWQACWSHLKRDFTKISEYSAETGKIGAALLEKEAAIFKLWYRVRDGTMTRKSFQTKMRAIRAQVGALLEVGTDCGTAKVEGMCKKILEVEDALWTFVDHEGIEPTNNEAERAIRTAVLWRKGSFGTQSDRGARYVERVLSTYATCKRQGRSIIQYLNEVCHAHANNLPAPSLLPDRQFVGQINQTP